MVTRTTHGPVAHEWTANEDDAGHHHGLLDFSAAPTYSALYWQSKRRGRTLHLGTYKLNLRELVKAGYAQEKTGRKVRLRVPFERCSPATISLRRASPFPVF